MTLTRFTILIGALLVWIFQGVSRTEVDGFDGYEAEE